MRQPHRVTFVHAATAVAFCASGCAPHQAGRGTDPATAPFPAAPPASAPAVSALAVSALAVDSALGVMAATPLWPGFEPMRTPVAIFDGRRTWLFRHPAPPAGYSPVVGRRDVVVRDGRDPVITANTSAQLGGVPTATVMLDSPAGASDLAALTVHELFHVFQRARHPSWQGNEADLFTYPVDDTTALALRREEWNVLRQALAATSADSARCWSRELVRVRGLRFAAVGGAAAAYERGTELNEGLAQYVERLARGRPVVLDSADAPAAQVRQRAYAVGAALATVLDRVSPRWRAALEARPDSVGPSLDGMLTDAGSGPTPASGECAASRARRAAWAADAAAEVRALRADRTRVRSEYLARAGWRLVIEAGDAPLFPQGFDPLNVARLSDTEILHTRFLRLQGTLGSLELLNGSVLTAGAPGAHPLFAGVRRVTITGISGPLAVHDSAGTLAMDGPGVVARLHGMRADTVGQAIRVTRR